MDIYPLNYANQYLIDGHQVVYSKFIEVAQGGPEGGIVEIDGKLVGRDGDYFGGPSVFYGGHMFIPQLQTSILGRHFILCVVNLSDRSVRNVGTKRDLILLKNAD